MLVSKEEGRWGERGGRVLRAAVTHHARLHIVFENKECLTGAHVFCPVKASRVLDGPPGGGR